LFLDDEGTLDPRLARHIPAPDLERVYHATVKKVGEDIEALRFNTAIAQLMIFVNEVTKSDIRPRQFLEPFVLLLAPFAPHIAEELWQKLGHAESLAREPWPSFDPAKIQSAEIEVVVQVNGKVRGKMTVPVDTPEAEIQSIAMADAAVKKHTEGKTLVKAVVVKNKLVNLVVR